MKNTGHCIIGLSVATLVLTTYVYWAQQLPEEPKPVAATLTALEDMKWEDVAKNYSLQDYIDAYQSGRLAKWLMKMDEAKKMERLKTFKLPVKGTLSKYDKYSLCEALYPSWQELPDKLRHELDRLSESDDEKLTVTDEQADKLFRHLSKYLSELSVVTYKDGTCVLCFKKKDSARQDICVLYPKDLFNLIQENPKVYDDDSTYNFITREPLFASDRDLRYVFDWLSEYIFDVARHFYGTNIRTVKYNKDGAVEYFSVVFNGSQPMTDSHMIMEEVTDWEDFEDWKDREKKKVSKPSYRFDKKQLQSLMGLSRMAVANKVLAWMDEAHLIKTEKD